MELNSSKHPKGFWVLFFYQIFEAFSFYGLDYNLIFFLLDHLNGGLGLSISKAIFVAGLFSSSCFLLAPLGGFISDYYISRKQAILLGSIKMFAGHFLLIYGNGITFVIALAFIIMGVNLYKCNVSALLGELYSKNNPQVDNAFTLHHLSNNIGSFSAGISVGFVVKLLGWQFGFLLNGISMFIGFLIFLFGKKHLMNKLDNVEEEKIQENIRERTSILTWKNLSKVEKKRLFVFFILIGSKILFISFYQQIAISIPIYIDQYVYRNLFKIDIPAGVFNALNPFFILVFTGIINVGWNYLQRRKSSLVTPISKIGISYIALSIGFMAIIASAIEKRYHFPETSALHWIIQMNILIVIAELHCLPISLTFCTHLVRPNIRSTALGMINLARGAGIFLAARISQLVYIYSDLIVFESIFFTSFLVGMLLIVYRKKIMQLTYE